MKIKYKKRKCFLIILIVFTFFFESKLNIIGAVSDYDINKAQKTQGLLIHIPDINKDYLYIQKHYGRTTDYLSYDFIEFIDQTLNFYKINEYIDLPMMLALIDVESEFIHERTSRAGAYGLCQIMKRTEKIINNDYKGWFDGYYLDRKNPYDNVTLSIVYLYDLLVRHDGDVESAIRFYNGGTKWKNNRRTKYYYNKIIKKRCELVDSLTTSQA